MKTTISLRGASGEDSHGIDEKPGQGLITLVSTTPAIICGR